MDFKKVICLTGFLAMLSAPVWADGNGYVASVTRQLKAQGYEITQISKTFLGRVRFEAKRRDVEREIVINPRTGEVLRDLNRTISGAVVVVVPKDQPELPTATTAIVTGDKPEVSKNSNDTDTDTSENTSSNDGAADADGDSGGDGGDGGSGGDGSGGGDGSD